MTPLVEQLNLASAAGTLVLQVGIVLLLVALFAPRRGQTNTLLALTARHALLMTFLLSSMATVMAFVYSDYFGFVPCGLCWLQRVFLMPIAVISGIALWKREIRAAADYIIGLSIPGLIIALYHHYIQVGGSELIGCPTAGGDCGQRIIFEFGYITFPLIAATVFAFCIVIMIIGKRYKA